MEKWRKGGELFHHQEQQMFSEQRKGKLSEKQNCNCDFNNHKELVGAQLCRSELIHD